MQETSCTCERCKAMCQRPCWPTADEALALMNAGYTEKLMLDYWDSKEKTIFLLCPAEHGSEGSHAPFMPGNGCVMQDANGLCILHDQQLKPIEGRLAYHEGKREINGKPLHKYVADLWDNEEAQKLARHWQRLMEGYE